MGSFHNENSIFHNITMDVNNTMHGITSEYGDHIIDIVTCTHMMLPTTKFLTNVHFIYAY